MYIATIGFFDGVHRGHQYLIAQLRNKAAEMGLRSMVVTFCNHPREVLHADFHPQLLTLSTEKERLLRRTGVDHVVMLPFTQEMAKLTSTDFMQMLREKYDVSALMMGYDHHFGHDAGSFEDYAARGKEIGVKVFLAQELKDEKVSSRLVRQYLNEGNVAQAAQLMSRPYGVDALVEHGKAIGRQLGFPTANLAWPQHQLMPKRGVYAVDAVLEDGNQWRGMLNIGQRPTIDNDVRTTIEVHLLDFTGNLYGREIHIDFLHRLRDEQHFANREALTEQLKHDAEMARGLKRPI